jgi:small subunit ribosomal protein S1
VLDIDRERQRISLGLKQTQSDPWQQVVDNYGEGDVVEGSVTKVVTFGAFIEILPGVEGLVHISELAQHHVENPREVVSQGDVVNVKVIEIDADRRRLSLSLKRVEEGETVQPRADGAPLAANLDLSEDVFGDAPATAEDAEVTDESIAEGSLEPVADDEFADVASVEVQEAPAEPEEPEAPEAEAEAEAEPAAEAEPEAEAEAPAADEEADQPA